MAFSVLAIIGNKKGKIGIAKSKSKEISIAFQKAIFKAKKKIIYIEIINGTLYHEIIGKYGASSIFISPAKKGTGIIAGKSSKAIFDVLGIKNIISKSYGSTNPYNVVKATLNGLVNINNPKYIFNKKK
uniref:S5 DRBM domain-containing protein n=1 Tax=Clastoptera arizonana TaxID=38151 RepID=A0A1B6DYN7_9HEMI